MELSHKIKKKKNEHFWRKKNILQKRTLCERKNILGEKLDREKKNTLQKCTLCEKKNFRKKVGQNAPTLDVIHERKGGHQKNSAGGTVKYFYGTFLKKCAASIHHVEIHIYV